MQDLISRGPAKIAIVGIGLLASIATILSAIFTIIQFVDRDSAEPKANYNKNQERVIENSCGKAQFNMPGDNSKVSCGNFQSNAPVD